MSNEALRRFAAGNGVKLWQVAEALGIADTSLSRKMRKELPPDEKRDFQQAVQAALAQLPNAQREAIIGEFWFGRKPDAKARREAIRALRHPRIRKPLMEYY